MIMPVNGLTKQTLSKGDGCEKISNPGIYFHRNFSHIQLQKAACALFTNNKHSQYIGYGAGYRDTNRCLFTDSRAIGPGNSHGTGAGAGDGKYAGYRDSAGTADCNANCHHMQCGRNNRE